MPDSGPTSSGASRRSAARASAGARGGCAVGGGGGARAALAHTARRGDGGDQAKTRYRITLPDDLMAVLRWHVDRLPPGPMRDSELLFPSETGGFRSASALDKPFREVGEAINLRKRVTPRAMRRSFQDLARDADIETIVRRRSAVTRRRRCLTSTARSPKRRFRRLSGRSSRSPSTASSFGMVHRGVKVVGKPEKPKRPPGRASQVAVFLWALKGLNLRLPPCEGGTLPLS